MIPCFGLTGPNNGSDATGQIDEGEVVKVDNKLRAIMKQIHNSCLKHARKYGTEGDYTLGANAGGFLRVANAAIAHGII